MGKKGLVLILILGGCSQTTGNFCDISSTLYFDSNKVVDYLSENDETLLREIVIHNETRKSQCS